jgi:hypothetical protein
MSKMKSSDTADALRCVLAEVRWRWTLKVLLHALREIVALTSALETLHLVFLSSGRLKC